MVQAKNRAPAPIQITAEQILRESLEFKEPTAATAPRTTLISQAEVDEHRLRSRKEFEDSVRRNRHNFATWIRYAQWEAAQHEWQRARSVWERAIDVDYRNVALWVKYAAFEMRHRFIAHARNVFDRAVTLHPRIDQLWYKYVYMEELLGETTGARAIFKRWMSFHPDERAWFSYIKFEQRQGAIDEVRRVYQQFTIAHNHVTSYIRYARWEERTGEIALARAVFDLCLKELKESRKTEDEKADEEEQLLIAYADFEERQREYDRARAIYRFALDHTRRGRVAALFDKYALFEKQHGDREELETVILAKRRLQYEEQLQSNPYQYDTYFDYLHLEQSMPRVDTAAVRALFERGVAAVPKVASKRAWKRYIYIWIYFAVWEELSMHDMDRVRQIYEKVLVLLQPLPFAFSKLYILYAEFALRQRDLPLARKIYGQAIARCGKDSVYLSYLELELLLGEVERCRRIYEKWLEQRSEKAEVWCRYAEMEDRLEEVERARRIMELGVGQGRLDRPERVWKCYIDLELRWMKNSVDEAADAETKDERRTEGRERVRRLYERLLQQSRHVKVYISYAQFEAGEKQWDRTRRIFTQADEHYRDRCKQADKLSRADMAWTEVREREAVREERVLLLSSWLEYEQLYGNREQQEAVRQRLPTRLTKKRERRDAMGEAIGGWEEYVEYVWAEEEKSELSGGLKMLEAARKWKQEQAKMKREQQERVEKELDAEDEQKAPAAVAPEAG